VEAKGVDRVRVLVVEDERLLADGIAEGLRRETLAVDVVYDGDAALERLGLNEYDVVVLDRDLPVVSGDEVCQALVDSGASTRVLMLTAATEVGRRVEVLALGADDYLGKPFVFAELVARIRALGRRSRPPAPPVLERGGLRLDPNRREVYRDGHYVALGAGPVGGHVQHGPTLGPGEAGRDVDQVGAQGGASGHGVAEGAGEGAGGAQQVVGDRGQDEVGPDGLADGVLPVGDVGFGDRFRGCW
jgi:CheY-like chemotaxis protein